MFFALTNGLLDAGIAVWECKRVYDSVHPITAIRHLFEGQRVTAWAGPFRGRQSLLRFRHFIRRIARADRMRRAAREGFQCRNPLVGRR